MAKSRYGLHINFIAGTVFGLCFGVFLSTWCRNKFIPCAPSFTRSGCCIENLQFNVNIEVEPADQNALKSSQAINNIFIEEADEKGFLFVGVMTAKKYLDSRAVSAYKTWARSINGKVVFFSSEGSTSKYDIPFVSLKNVDDSYPPQKKSFSMLKYMADHYLDKYEWFMRADDDAFVKGDLMEQFLRSVNSSKPQFIGQAGVGTKEEIGLLSLGNTDNYCMGGTGIVFSHETLRKIAPHLKYCVNNLYTTHEDVEIGRCVRQFAGIPCTWAFEMQKLFYQNFKEYRGSFIDTLQDKEVQTALTMHPIKDPSYQYRINNHFTSEKILALRQKEIELQREISDMNQLLNEQTKTMNKYGLRPSVTTFIPTKEKDVLGWEYVSTRSVSSHLNVNPRKGMNAFRKHALDNTVYQTMDIINKNSRQRGRTIDFKDVLYGYVQTDPLNGVSYILDILLTYRKHKGKTMNAPVRRHAYLHQTFTETEFIEDPLTLAQRDQLDSQMSPFTYKHLIGSKIPQAKLKETVHFIVPLAGKVREFDRFMKNYEDICLRTRENSQMHVVLFTKNSFPDEVEEILKIVGQYQKKYGGELLEVLEADGDFARAKALDLGAKQCSDDDLLFCVDVDILLTADSLNRIRLNTIQNVQIYYPIVFSQYDPDTLCNNKTLGSQCNVEPLDFSPRMGYWRQFGYGIAAMYRSDLEKVGGYDTSIQGWGKEDVDLFDKFVQNNITVFRAVDTGMIHVFHPIRCDVNLEPSQFQMCIGSKATCLASQQQLAEMVLQMKNVLDREVPSV
uniref:Hexosyltransferase n=1 Tax=Sinonovacula constricta TaxID=98310 RepID=A0AA96HC70_SINCO|nr:chondroitin sulfate synthase 1 [Sinonovacula constricta]